MGTRFDKAERVSVGINIPVWAASSVRQARSQAKSVRRGQICDDTILDGGEDEYGNGDGDGGGDGE